jgi:sugar lactone lactonase YvrE
MVLKNHFIILLFTVILLSSGPGEAREKKPLVPNYPLNLLKYIYGNNEKGIKDTPDTGGTPVSIAQNSKGHLFLLYTGNRWEIQVFNQNGKFMFRFGERGDKDWQFSGYANGLDINSKDEVLIADVKKCKILVFDQYGKYLRSFSSIKGLVPEDPKKDTYPSHIAVGPMDQIYISDGRNGHVWIFDPAGSFLKHLGGPELGLFPSAGHIRFDSKRRIYILEGIPNRIQICSQEGDPVMQIGETGNRAGQFLRISGLALDSVDRVYATDVVQCIIQIFNTSGNLIGVVKEYISPEGDARKFASPSGIFIGRNDMIYVIEQPKHRLVVLKPPPKTNQGEM